MSTPKVIRCLEEPAKLESIHKAFNVDKNSEVDKTPGVDKNSAVDEKSGLDKNLVLVVD